MKWIKRLLLLVACLLAMAIVVSAASYWMLRNDPEWYVQPTLTPEMRQAAAARAQHQFSRVGEMAANLRAYEVRRQRAIAAGTTVPAAEVPGPITVRLTQDEINAFYTTNAKFRGWDIGLSAYVTDPRIVLQEGRLIIAGKVPEMQNIVASMHFAPSVDESGHLRADLVRVLGGKLPLPEMMVSKYREKLMRSLRVRMPGWQRYAKIDASGLPNQSAVAAALGKLLVAAINQQPADPVLFLPLSSAGDQYIPVKVTAARVLDSEVQFTLSPVSEEQRPAILKRIKEPVQLNVAEK